MLKRSIIVPVVVLGVAAVLLFTIKGCWTSWEGGKAEQRTDDAYVRADLTPMSTRVSGTVKKMDVGDFESVKPGQPLVELEDADYRADLAEAEAALAGARAQLEDNHAAKRVQDAKIQSAEANVIQATAAVNAANAGVDAVSAEVERTKSELKRQQALVASRAATQQQLEQATADAGQFSGTLASRKADLDRARSAVVSSQSVLEAERRQRAALDTEDGLLRAQIQAKEAAMVVTKVNLGYTLIVAPTAGAVGERHVQEGQLVGAGMQVIDMVKGDVWIQANFKETQLTNIRTGDVADIRVDTFPGVVLQGKVLEIAPASGSQFALLPPDNATGNFTKVVQRIPVKIILDPGHPLQGRLRPGFSVVVTVHASGKNAKLEESQP